ncbi:MAG: hypothetical protein J5527_11115 [Treponema sp.]|nr:hypothetical protein [Treponema sp.]
MKLKNLIKKIWNDNVFGSVISSFITSLIVFLVGLLASKKTIIKDFFLQKISIYLFSIIILSIFIIVLFISLHKRNKKLLSSKDKEINALLNEIKAINSEICELKKETENPRMSLFTNGDVVIIKGSNAYFSVVEYTVVDKTKDSIIIVDNQGTSKTISPDALLTTKEYREESDKQKKEYEMSLNQNRNRKGYDPFSYI